ncbi:MAG: sulfatase [Salinibacter sp.]|uniref:sulfatase n=1 Tax=Salinibacter sp. TaxID=2065818 RepID=UPI0035D3FD79
MSDRPNLVFAFADQLRTQSCGYAGDRYDGGTYANNPEPYTPNIDRLAEQSADVREAVAVNPICCPYRASLVTGKYPSSTGMVINELRAMPDPDALGHVLGEHGYRTSYLGKWHMYGKDHSPSQQFIPPGPHRQGFDQEWKAYNFNHEYYDGFYYEDTFDRIDLFGYQPHAFTDQALTALRRGAEGDAPFALFLSYGPPHDPWTWDNVPDPFAHLFRDAEFPDPPNYADGHARYWHPEWDEQWWLDNWKPHRHRKRQVYAAQTASLDWEIGRLMHAMRRLGLEEDTIFVFTSDHGEMFGSQGRIAKKIFYEEAARVPFLVRWPGTVEPRVTDACLNTPDIAPTLLRLMDLPVPDSMEGQDLSPIVRGRDGERPDAAFMQGMGHTFQWHDGDEWRAARDGQHVYATMLDGDEYLFDHRRDPYQLNNLADDPEYRDVRDRLRNWMRGKMDELNDSFRPTTWYRDQWVEDRVILRSATRELEPRFRPEHLDDA